MNKSVSIINNLFLSWLITCWNFYYKKVRLTEDAIKMKGSLHASEAEISRCKATYSRFSQVNPSQLFYEFMHFPKILLIAVNLCHFNFEVYFEKIKNDMIFHWKQLLLKEVLYCYHILWCWFLVSHKKIVQRLLGLTLSKFGSPILWGLTVQAIKFFRLESDGNNCIRIWCFSSPIIFL